MKLQAIMNRAVSKQGTDLQDIVRLILCRCDPRHWLNLVAAKHRLPQTSHSTSISGWCEVADKPCGGFKTQAARTSPPTISTSWRNSYSPRASGSKNWSGTYAEGGYVPVGPVWSSVTIG